MAAITTRVGKGSALTTAEVDANFTNLNTDKAEKSTTISAGTGLSGGGDLSANRTIGLANTAVTAGSYGSATAAPTFTVDAQGRLTAAGSTTVTPAWSSITGKPTTLSGYGITDAQPLDADLTSIAGLAGTTGFLKKTAANTWALDTNTYLTGNQSISISGDATGSGATAIALTLANSGVTAGTYTKITVDAKGRATVGTTLAASDIPELTLEKLPNSWVKRSVRVATTANITLSGTQTIDGVAVVAGDRVLVKDQTTASQNGIYVVAAGGWTRAADADAIAELAGALVSVDSGTANGGLRFDTDLKTTDTLGTTSVNWHRVYDTNDATTTSTANKLALRDANADLFMRYGMTEYVSMSHSAGARTADTVFYSSTDNYIRKNTDAGFRQSLNVPTRTGGGASGTWGISISGSAATLTTGRTIGMTGDVTWTSASFNGSANVTGTATLANSGVTAGTYTKITVDAKGRATSGTTLTAADIPELTLAKMPGSTYKQSVRCATTANITLSGTQTIDGIAVVAGDRVLVKNQTAAAENGIYVVAAGAWTRAADADAAAEIGAAVVAVDSGTANGGEMWTTTFRTTDTLGTTAMNWYEVLFNTGTWGINISGSAATLTTARTINGTSFNGSANITTANWGTARTLTIGNTGKSVNGSANVSWSLTEIGAPSTTGTGASGTWGISINGNVNTGNGGSGNGFFAGTGDGSSSTIANVQIKSWYGIGFSPSITGQAVPQNENAIWMDVRGGHMTMRGNLTVGSAGLDSSITMGDADNGARAIYCNSDRIGFLNQSSGWGAWCNDDGRWTAYAGAEVAGEFVGGWGRYGTVVELRTDGAGAQDGPRVYFHKATAKAWSAGIQAGSGNSAWAIWEDGGNTSWGTERFKIAPGGYTTISGSLQVNGNDIYVGWGGSTASYIYMNDADEGSRTIHCNSNRIGFLNQSGGWGAFCNDDGSWWTDAYFAAGTGGTGYVFTSDTDTGMWNPSDGNLWFKVNGVYRQTINGNGRSAFYGTQGGIWDNRVVLVEHSGSYDPGIGFHAPSSSAAGIIKFHGPGNRFEFRNSNDSGWHDVLALAFYGQSDYRLKTDVEPLASGLAELMLLQPKKYRYFSSGNTARGFLAHEVQPHIPEAVKGEFDAEDDRGFPIHQSLDPTSILATAVKAIQELKQLVDQLQAEIAALKGEAA